MVELYTLEPEALLATLFAENLAIHELEVVGAGLEEAFVSLTTGDHAERAPGEGGIQ